MTYNLPRKETCNNNNENSTNKGDSYIYEIYDPKCGQFITKMPNTIPGTLLDNTSEDNTSEDMYIKIFQKQVQRPPSPLSTAPAISTPEENLNCYENVTLGSWEEMSRPRNSIDSITYDEFLDQDILKQHSESKKISGTLLDTSEDTCIQNCQAQRSPAPLPTTAISTPEGNLSCYENVIPDREEMPHPRDSIDSIIYDEFLDLDVVKQNLEPKKISGAPLNTSEGMCIPICQTERPPAPLPRTTILTSENLRIQMCQEQAQRSPAPLPITATLTPGGNRNMNCYENVILEGCGEMHRPLDSIDRIKPDKLLDLNVVKPNSEPKKMRPTSLPATTSYTEPIIIDNTLSLPNCDGSLPSKTYIADAGNLRNPASPRHKFKGFKSMTLFSRSSPKRRTPEPTSHFYVNTEFGSINEPAEKRYTEIETDCNIFTNSVSPPEDKEMGTKRCLFSKTDTSPVKLDIKLNDSLTNKTADIQLFNENGRSDVKDLCEHNPDDYINLRALPAESPEVMIRDFGHNNKSQTLRRTRGNEHKYTEISLKDQSKKQEKKLGSPEGRRHFEEEIKQLSDENGKSRPCYVNVAILGVDDDIDREGEIDEMFKKRRSKSVDHTSFLSSSKTGLLEFVELKGKGLPAGNNIETETTYVNLQVGSPSNLDPLTEDKTIVQNSNILNGSKNLYLDVNLPQRPIRLREDFQLQSHNKNKNRYYTTIDTLRNTPEKTKSSSPVDSPPDSPDSPRLPKQYPRKQKRNMYCDVNDITVIKTRNHHDLSPKRPADNYVNFKFGESPPQSIRKSRSYENLLGIDQSPRSIKKEVARGASNSYANLEFPDGMRNQFGRRRSDGRILLSPKEKDLIYERMCAGSPSPPFDFETKQYTSTNNPRRPISFQYDEISHNEQRRSPRNQRTAYTEIDFEKSRSVAVAVKELRSSSTSSIDLEHEEATI